MSVFTTIDKCIYLGSWGAEIECDQNVGCLMVFRCFSLLISFVATCYGTSLLMRERLPSVLMGQKNIGCTGHLIASYLHSPICWRHHCDTKASCCTHQFGHLRCLLLSIDAYYASSSVEQINMPTFVKLSLVPSWLRLDVTQWFL